MATPEEIANALKVLGSVGLAPAATAAANTGSKTPATRIKTASVKAEVPKTLEEAQAIIARLQANRQSLSLKVSEKGAVSVYGLGRFPVTLYRSQMEALLDATSAIRDFMKANAAKLTARE